MVECQRTVTEAEGAQLCWRGEYSPSHVAILVNMTSKQHILIVDDSATDLLYLKRLLSADGREISTATTGEEAVETVSKHDFAVVLLDVQLPDMDGYETAERIRANEEEGAGVPIIFVTATRTAADQVFKGYDSGAVDYLFKPVEPSLLRSKVKVFCELRGQRDVIAVQLKEIQTKNEELEQRLSEIKTLRGLIPICASCKKVRDDSGYWESIESYVRERSAAEFSHSVCPDCARELYPSLMGGEKSKGSAE